MKLRALDPEVEAALDAKLRAALVNGAHPHGTYEEVRRRLAARFGAERVPSSGVVATRAKRLRRDLAAHERRRWVRDLRERMRETDRAIADAAAQLAAEHAARAGAPDVAELRALVRALQGRAADGVDGAAGAR